MNTTTPITGEVALNRRIFRFEININEDGSGRVGFATIERFLVDGVVQGLGEMVPHEAQFSELPATFPVTINGNVVQVAGQTILDALDSVAASVMALQE